MSVVSERSRLTSPNSRNGKLNFHPAVDARALVAGAFFKESLRLQAPLHRHTGYLSKME